MMSCLFYEEDEPSEAKGRLCEGCFFGVMPTAPAERTGESELKRAQSLKTQSTTGVEKLLASALREEKTSSPPLQLPRKDDQKKPRRRTTVKKKKPTRRRNDRKGNLDDQEEKKEPSSASPTTVPSRSADKTQKKKTTRKGFLSRFLPKRRPRKTSSTWDLVADMLPVGLEFREIFHRRLDEIGDELLEPDARGQTLLSLAVDAHDAYATHAVVSLAARKHPRDVVLNWIRDPLDVARERNYNAIVDIFDQQLGAIKAKIYRKASDPVSDSSSDDDEDSD
mmetsp:Transcript_38162/g.122493  ORF Transcript_38162/g.122493 Transcript_38162/m.122493 type:complete len:280 (-) Transcript_38162:205-1044(-)